MTAKATTNATRVLDARKAAYALRTFAAADFTAEEAAEKLGVPPEEVWKTLVAKGDRTGPLAAVIPTGTRLSLKKLARVSGNRTVAMVSPGGDGEADRLRQGGLLAVRDAQGDAALRPRGGGAPRRGSSSPRGSGASSSRCPGPAFLAAAGATTADLVED